MTLLMTHRRALVTGVVLVVPVLILLTAEGIAQMRLAGNMTAAAERLLASLSPEQKARLNQNFETLERFNWHYIPRMRKGLSLRELPANQKKLALDLLKSGLSTYGYETTEKIRGLERILIEREKNGSMPMVRDPENYFVVVFGTPSREQPWGWRFEGHHISVNFTIVGGDVRSPGPAPSGAPEPAARVIANTPLFFGAEPAEVQGGASKGLRVLGAVEDKARALIDALDAEQRAAAVVSTLLPSDIFSGNDRAPDLGSQLNPIGLDRQPERLGPDGLAAARMTARQKDLLRALVEEYVSRMPDEIAQQRTRTLAAELEKASFAWIGATRAADAPKPTASFGCAPGDPRWECIPLGFPYYYRVQAPSFLIEYMNTNGNHSHSVWRDFQNGDFGEDLLADHYARFPHPGITSLKAHVTRPTSQGDHARNARRPS